VVGLRDSWATLKVSSTTMGLPGGKMPKTGSPTTRDIAQAEQFALSVVQSRPTQCQYV
jgi:predicted flavoprotein YhiN